MMKREENPELFKAICDHLGMGDLLRDEPIQILSDEQLAQVTDLYLNSVYTISGSDVRDLRGIEKLVNLKFLNIEGRTTEDPQFYKLYTAQYYPGQARELGAYIHDENQVKDFSPLKNCKNLEKIEIKDQRKFVNLDLDGLDNLKRVFIQGCPNFASIDNVSAPIKNNSLKTLIIQDCLGFKGVADMAAVVDNIADGYQLKCELPVNAFIPMVNKNPELREKLCDKKIDLVWNDMRGKYNSRKMLMALDRITDIVNTVCREDESDFAKLSRVYRYFCDTAHYSHDDSGELKNENRKSLSILFDKNAVCQGISRAFNLCGQYLGFNMVENLCLCNDEKKAYQQEQFVIDIDHSVSLLTAFDRQTMQKMNYYFDLTWDLGKDESQYFALNKWQFSQNHQFTIDDGTNFSNVAPDLQVALEQEGLLTTSERNKAVQADLVQRAHDYSVEFSMQ